MDFADFVGLAAIAVFFLVCGSAAWQLHRLRREGLAAARPRLLHVGDWQLAWPEAWDDPRPTAGHFEAATGDHDGQIRLHPLAGAAAAEPPESCLRAFLSQRALQLDDWILETAAAAHGPMHCVEGRASCGDGRAYCWLARVPGARSGSALLLFYRASVLYGLADGYWMHQIALAARETPAGSKSA